MGATWSPTTGPSADVTPPPELTAPATTLQSDPDEQQSTERSDDSTQIYVYAIIALSVVIVNCGVCGVYGLHDVARADKKKRTPSEPNHDQSSFEQSSVTVPNSACCTAPPNVECEPMFNGPGAACSNNGDIGDAYEVGQTLNPIYEPTLPERMGNRLYANGWETGCMRGLGRGG